MMCRFKTGKLSSYVYMEAINDIEEENIDKLSAFIKDNKTIANSNSILMYGDVDVNNQDDIDFINKANILNEDEGNYIKSNFDYENSTFTTIDRIPKYYPTFNHLLWFKYHHAIIGKPKKIIIYKVIK